MSKKADNVEHYFTERPMSKARFGLIRTYLRRKPFDFMTASGVFSKDRIDLGTRLLVESMVLPKNGCLLDVGCGYGAVGIAAAVFNPNLHVDMVDVNIRAVRLARQNAKLNHVWNVEIKHGRLYEAVEDVVFDCVVSNPPVSAGMKTVEAIIACAPEHMSSKATLQVVVKSKIGGRRLLSFFEEAFGNVDVLARGSGYRVLISQKQ
jgi:16S rRNA (guanine1207-N2)-methyltransferase